MCFKSHRCCTLYTMLQHFILSLYFFIGRSRRRGTTGMWTFFLACPVWTNVCYVSHMNSRAACLRCMGFCGRCRLGLAKHNRVCEKVLERPNYKHLEGAVSKVQYPQLVCDPSGTIWLRLYRLVSVMEEAQTNVTEPFAI